MAYWADSMEHSAHFAVTSTERMPFEGDLSEILIRVA
jgi:hypothetical protein